MRQPVVLTMACLVALLAPGCLQPPPPPYQGLGRDGYGPLSRRPYGICDPNDTADPLVDGLARGVTSVFYDLMREGLQHDTALYSEGLQDQFRFSADSPYPPVVLLDRSRRGIVFWYIGRQVRDEEVANAAAKYCRQAHGLRAAYEGAARRCGEVQRVALRVNGRQLAFVPTYVIAAFQCL
ncbi:hypothetical protein M0638_21875 [Roseomonas sp. NAR14]|uniref:Lipoprotein n=1 Tax=Roseomonas acroporae TaxID=2937791 RepID=A0A9X1YC45_9PROT|nr:hypothetical protein [Roseomonas acroporae]MCK8787027.1 hypothetical protein [Roseomonas acroporae]